MTDRVARALTRKAWSAPAKKQKWIRREDGTRVGGGWTWNKNRVPPEERDYAILGTVPDADVAALWGISVPTVCTLRSQRRIPSHRSRTPGQSSTGERADLRADPEKMALLGTAPDAHLARLWGMGLCAVRDVRMQHNIPRYRGARPDRLPEHAPDRSRPDFLEGDAARIALLGTTTDTALAKQWGVSSVTVGNARNRRGIPVWGESSGPRGTSRNPDLLALLGTAKDVDLADRFGCSREMIRQMREKRDIPAFEAPDPEWWADVGTMTDRAVAEKWGVSTYTVTARRNRLGIPVCRADRRAIARQMREARRGRPTFGKECYDLAASVVADGERVEWTAVADVVGAVSGGSAFTNAFLYAKRWGLPWPLNPPRTAAPATYQGIDLAEAYRLRAEGQRWPDLDRRVGRSGEERSYLNLRRAVEGWAKREGKAWPPTR